MAEKRKNKLGPELLDEIAARIELGVQVRRSLPPDGRVHIDRLLPFLIVYRPPPGAVDVALKSLVASQASYVIAPSDPSADSQRFVLDLVERIATLQSKSFGGFLLIEVSLRNQDEEASSVTEDVTPDFEVAIPKNLVDTPAVNALVGELSRVRILGHKGRVKLSPSVTMVAPHVRRLLSPAAAKATNTHAIGLMTYPAWESSTTGESYPLVKRAMIRQMARSLAQTAFVFAREETSSQPLHYQALGRRAVVRAVRDIDRQLAKVAESFDLLLTVTPINSDSAYRKFRSSKYTKAPRFQYRPHTVDPSMLKRKLFDIKIERVEDPTLEALFREKQSELELKLSLIGARLSPRFLPTSVALYGKVDNASMALASSVMESLGQKSTGAGGRRISGETFAAAAEIEIATYHVADGSITPRVELRDDVSSLMVSAGNLLVGRNMSIPVSRVQALLQHEVGTHVVTYWNGRAQPFRLLASGLARHDELQEGLAVFAEYIVGGLTPARLRTLAARVIAARSVSDGAEFIETYRLLVDDVGMGSKGAFGVAMRVHRGGGLVKDAVYLRGLQGVVDYVHKGGRLDTLLVGKIAPEHTAVIEELQRREILITPPLRPNFLKGPDAHYRIEKVRAGISLVDMVDGT